jgi:hypothetical protein
MESDTPPSLLAIPEPESCFIGLLYPARDSHAAASSHKSYATLERRLCLQIPMGGVVRITDFASEKYWGERILQVQPPIGPLRDMSWPVAESSLVELADPIQRIVDQWEPGDYEGFSAFENDIANRWRCACEKAALEEASAQTANPNAKRPRI